MQYRVQTLLRRLKHINLRSENGSFNIPAVKKTSTSSQINLNSSISGSKHQIRSITETRSPRSTLPSNEAAPVPTLDLLTLTDPGRTAASRNPPIREQLKSWSIQNERLQAENAPENVVVGRTVYLPNSLFVKSEVSDEGLQEDLDSVGNSDASNVEPPESAAVFLEPGDLFQISGRRIKLQLAIFLGMVGTQSQYFLEDGSWMLMERQIFKSYTIRGFVSQEEIEKIRAFLPTQPVEAPRADGGQILSVQAKGDIPHNVAKPILSKFAQVIEEGDSFKRNNLSKLETLYDMFADDKYWKTIPYDDLVQQAFGIDLELLSPGAKLTIFSNLVEDDFRTKATINRNIGHVYILPRRLAQSVENTTRWARKYQDAAAKAAIGKEVSKDLESNPLTAFINKARRLISHSRKIRSPTSLGNLGPARASPEETDMQPSGESFDGQDRQIIEFLWYLYVKRPYDVTPPTATYQAVGALILRAIGAYPKLVLDRRVGKLLLQEMGCLNPWDDPMYHQVHTTIPHVGLGKEAIDMKRKEDQAVADLAWDPSSSSYPFPDTAAQLRKDWGSLEIFCIDNANTQIVDDGVSIEPAADRPGFHWLHAHIAHPSAFIPYKHPFERRARFQGSTYYGAIFTQPAMPFEILEKLSLGTNCPTLTVSTLISPSGESLDIQVTPGIARNVIHLTHKAVHEVVSTEQADDFVLNIGSAFKDQPDSETGTNHAEIVKQVKKHAEKLSLIQKVLASRRLQRRKENPEFLDMKFLSQFRPKVNISPIEEHDGYQRLFQSKHSYDDPSIRVTTSRKPEALTTDVDDDNIVMSAMVLAGESLGCWLKERNIPAIYLGHYLAPNFSVSKLNNLGQNEGYINPISKNSISPIPHVMYNLRQYAVGTSPLRRYRDLHLQYQIDSYLKAEASGIVSKGAPVIDESILAFSENDLLEFIKDLGNGRRTATFSSHSVNYWVAVALFRAHHFQEAKLPNVWDVEIDNPVAISKHLNAPDAFLNGRLVPLGLKAVVHPSVEGFEKQAKFRQFLPVKIDVVDPESPSVECRAVGPATDHPLSLTSFGR